MRKAVLVGLLAALAIAAASVAAIGGHASATGPSSSQSPYLVASHDGVELRSIITVGDPVGGAVDGYRLTGLPDGLGAFKGKEGTFTLLANHEIPSANGVARAHGAIGAFVSQWTIRKDDLSVLAGKDLIQQQVTWNAATASYNAPTTGVALNRLCSADLPDPDAFYDAKSRTGYDAPLFMDGEETSDGRGWAHTLGGTSYQLASLGRFAWENSVANPSTGKTTVVVGLDDTNPLGQVYVYVGEKKNAGNPAERAGLTGGTLYGIKIPGTATEPAGTGFASGTAFTAASLGDVSALTAAQLETASDTAGVTEWQRPEDGAWDPKHPNDLYFVVTASFGANSKLYRLHFADPADPAAGGTVSQLLEGTETGGTGERYHMLDNMAVDRHGHIVLQEDPGGQDYLARVWLYDIAHDDLTELAHHDPVRFSPASITRLTVDEESSGVIDAEKILGRGWFLLDVQAHYANVAALVEGGQLLAMHVPKIHPDEPDDEDGGE